ncbi:MAG: SRPBCC family protein [Saprospiraceae bacterium]|nr:SRPBCC family protein [Lewinella sp.]
MKVKEKRWEQFIPQDLEQVWHFFSRPENLNDITPEDMSFEILSDVADTPMYEGMVIRYNIRPILNIPMNWVTEITHVRAHVYFIDEQRFGPYALWHHQHHFEAVRGGTLMKDILHYKVPYGIIGNIADAVFVDKKIESIFRYRFQVIEEQFKSESVAS